MGVFAFKDFKLEPEGRLLHNRASREALKAYAQTMAEDKTNAELVGDIRTYVEIVGAAVAPSSPPRRPWFELFGYSLFAAICLGWIALGITAIYWLYRLIRYLVQL